MNPSERVKAFAYMRCSGQGQISGDTFDRQSDAINLYAAAHGIQIVGVFKDEGISGTLKNRPSLAEMMLRLEENGVKTVVVEKLDRLARDLMVQEFLIADFKSKGFLLHSACEGDKLLSEDPTRVMIRQILGAVSQYDKAMLVMKLRAARDRKRAKTGRCEGPLGYKEKVPKLRAKILAMRADGLKDHQIAEKLNSQRVKSLWGKPFTRRIVQNILHKAV